MTSSEQVYTVVEPPTSELFEKAALDARGYTQRMAAGFIELLLDSGDGQFLYGILKINAITYAASAKRPHAIDGRIILENEPPALELVIHLPNDPNEPASALLERRQMEVASTGDFIDSLSITDAELADAGAAEIGHVGTGTEKLA